MFMADWQCSSKVDSGETSKPEKNHEKNSLRKQRSFSVEGIKLQFLLYKTKMLLFQLAIDEIVIHHIFELSSSLHFAVHSGSIGGIFLDYTASQFLSVYKKEAGANRMPID